MSSERTRVYVTGPLSKGDVALNVRAAVITGSHLMDRGYAPYIPHLSHFIHMLAPKPYEEWMRLDKEWLLLCHVMIRLPGQSDGADRECQWAADAGIPIFTRLDDLMAKVSAQNPPARLPELDEVSKAVERDCELWGITPAQYQKKLERYFATLTCA